MPRSALGPRSGAPRPYSGFEGNSADSIVGENIQNVAPPRLMHVFPSELNGIAHSPLGPPSIKASAPSAGPLLRFIVSQLGHCKNQTEEKFLRIKASQMRLPS